MNSGLRDDVESVREAVMTYVEGVVNFDFDKGESPWHGKGVKISYDANDEVLNMSTISETRPSWNEEQLKQVKKRISQSGRIISSDVTGDAAYVKLVWDFKMDESRKEISDHILLLKIDDEWKIVGKVFDERTIR
jgi:hypothetical protein